MQKPWSCRHVLAALGLGAAIAACNGARPSGAEASAQPSASAPPPAASSATLATEREPADEVRPNYPVTKDPADPLAAKLCKALWDLPVERKRACCPGSHDPAFGAECTRVVSAAVRLEGAALVPAAVDACVAALEKQTEGCDWVGLALPRAPDACAKVLEGKLVEKAKCRSSLECAEGLSCVGVGPTTIGICAKPLGDGGFCGTAVDPLAGMARAEDYEKVHPQCAGACYRNRCLSRVADGVECKSSVECAVGSHCLANKCSPAPLPAVGEACPGGLCRPEGRCVHEKCEAYKVLGDDCLTGLECRSGHCSEHETGLGKCESACAPAHLPPNPRPPASGSTKKP